MEISYRTKGIYNVLEASLGTLQLLEEGGCMHKIIMIRENEIYGLIRPDYYELDGNVQLDYNISSLYLLDRMMKVKKPDGKILKQIMSCLCKSVFIQDSYLLNPNDIVFTNEYLFYDSMTDDICMINLPGYNKDLRLQIKDYLEMIMKIFNHCDREGLEYMYGMYDMVSSDNFELSVFQKYVNSNLKSVKSKSQSNKTENIALKQNIELIPLSNGQLENIVLNTYCNQVSVGREQKDASYVIASQQISRLHASIYTRENNIYIMDQNSTNGTFVNAEKILAYEEVGIKSGDVVAFANEEFFVQ